MTDQSEEVALVDVMAQAINANWTDSGATAWDDLDEMGRAPYRSDAAAALAALRGTGTAKVLNDSYAEVMDHYRRTLGHDAATPPDSTYGSEDGR